MSAAMLIKLLRKQLQANRDERAADKARRCDVGNHSDEMYIAANAEASGMTVPSRNSLNLVTGSPAPTLSVQSLQAVPIGSPGSGRERSVCARNPQHIKGERGDDG